MNVFFVLYRGITQNFNQAASLQVFTHMIFAKPCQADALQGHTPYRFTIIRQKGAMHAPVNQPPFFLKWPHRGCALEVEPKALMAV